MKFGIASSGSYLYNFTLTLGKAQIENAIVTFYNFASKGDLRTRN
jgi:hypothetical protein